MTREEAKKYINSNPQLFLTKAKKDGFICPLCSNGSGTEGTGIVFSKTDKPNFKMGHCKCQKCGFYGDMISLAAAANGKPFPSGTGTKQEYIDSFNAAYAYCGITIDDEPIKRPEKQKPEEKKEQPMIKADYTKLIENSMTENAPAVKYLESRGLTAETADLFHIGYQADSIYFAKAEKKLPAVIIPYNTENTYYSARSIDGKFFHKPKTEEAGAEPLFNIECVKKEEDKPIFIVESAFCAMSIVQCGGAAIALGGAGYTRVVPDLNQIDGAKLRTYVVSLDNDDAGKNNGKNLLLSLKSSGYYAYSMNIADDCKDPNELLQRNPEALTANIRRADTQKQIYLMQSAAGRMSKFIDYVKSTGDNPYVSTGLKNVDALFDKTGIYNGLYVIGGGSSVGKTAFTVQIAEEIALQKDVLYFSFEMSEFELMARSISRYSFLNYPDHALKTREVMFDKFQKFLNRDKENALYKSEAEYANNTEHFYIVEVAKRMDVDGIRKTVEHHVDMTGNRPCVVIDYLQLVKPRNDRMTDKQAVDDTITSLKQISRDFDVPVLVISSFNRGSYDKDAKQDAFKESGAIEYTADCILALQIYNPTGDKNFDYEEAKRNPERTIEVKMLKQRSGTATGKTTLKFYAEYMLFDDDPDAEKRKN